MTLQARTHPIANRPYRVLVAWVCVLSWCSSAQSQDVTAPQPASQAQNGTEAGGIRGTIVDSLRLLTVQHAIRTTFEVKTRRELGGPFFQDYVRSLEMPRQWSDGDSWFTNNVGHPMQGAASGFVWLNNHGQAEGVGPGDPGYWKSRLMATAWAAAYSVQFEIGPYSEASIGNVGLYPQTLGWTDHIMTPVGGLGFVVVEDLLDKYVLSRLERRLSKPFVRNSLRVVMNPSRSFANVARAQAPWYRSRPPR